MEEISQVSLASLEMPLETDSPAVWSGTRALMLAVLEDAIQQFGSTVPRSHAEAERWIMSPERQHVFSFAVICETLGLEPSTVRRSLIRLLDRKATGDRLVKRSRPNVRQSRAIRLSSAQGKAL